MSLACTLLASFLLLVRFPIQGAVSKDRVVWGALDQDINLNIPGFQMRDDIDDIRWDKEGIMVAQFRKGKRPSRVNEMYDILANGSLKIKHLKGDHNSTFHVTIYNRDGTLLREEAFDLRIQEMVSKPKIIWDCDHTNLTCEVLKGSDPELNLYQREKHLLGDRQRLIRYQWTNLNAAFKCTAKNRVSRESSMATISCSEHGLKVYLIVGSCVGGLLLMVLVALLILYISRRKKQNSRRNDGELEIRTCRITENRSQIPAAPSQTPAVPQPPPPAHRPQVPGHRPLPPVHRAQHQQQKRPPPSGTQVRQQRGPPLPRPRVQQKPPYGSAEDSLSPCTN